MPTGSRLPVRRLVPCLLLALLVTSGRAPSRAAAQAPTAACDPNHAFDAPRGSHRYATAEDAAAIPNANVGDYILEGANTGVGSIYISPADNWHNSPTLGPGKKILIKGGSYSQIMLKIPTVVGSAEAPVVITNYGGKVSTPKLTIEGARHFKLTGRYDPARQTGDPGYLGWETSQPFFQGQFGFDVRAGWADGSSSALSIGGNATDYELEYLELGDGGFAGMLLKTNSGSVDMVNVKIHENYIHDADGEGIYLGSTQSDPQHQFRNLHIYDNVIVRSGLNTLQVGQLSTGVLVEHNALVMGGINWKSPFQKFQDAAVQISARRGGTTFRNNMVIGGGGGLLSAFVIPKTGLAPDPASPMLVENNLFLANHSRNGAYVENRGDSVTPWIVRNNLFGQLKGDYTTVYQSDPAPSTIAWAGYNGTTARMVASGNRFDATAPIPYVKIRGTAKLTDTDNLQGAVPAPRFVNFMELPQSYDYLTVEKWNRAVGEEPGFPITGTHKGDPIVYSLGDRVMHHGRLYRSKQSNNVDHQPQGMSDSWWELVTFASTGSHCVPDDLRLHADDFYARRGIGLRRTLVPPAWPRVYLPSV